MSDKEKKQNGGNKTIEHLNSLNMRNIKITATKKISNMIRKTTKTIATNYLLLISRPTHYILL